jgi:photosystem II stability/assembly factor-like uncharacterized protein
VPAKSSVAPSSRKGPVSAPVLHLVKGPAMVDELRLLRQLLEVDPLPDDPGLAEAIKARLEADVGAVSVPSVPRPALLAPLGRAEPVLRRKAIARRDSVGQAPLAPPPVPGRDAQRQWRDRRRRRLALGSLTAAVAVAAVALGTSLVITEGVAPAPRWAFAGQITSWAQVPGSGAAFSTGLTCPSVTTCYAAGLGGSVEVTRDGGKTWHPAPTRGGAALSNVACSSTGECAFLAEGPSGKPLFFETADAGRTWTSHPGPADLSSDYQLTKGPSGSRFSGGPTDLSCSSASACTLVAPDLASAFVTEDEGRSWSATSPTAAAAQVQCFRDGRCVSAGPTGASYSTDNGLAWSSARVPADFSGPMGPPGALSCASPETCTIVWSPFRGSGVALFVSGDGGKSWSAVDPQGLPAGKDYTGLACLTASQCWMSGNTPIVVDHGLGMDFRGTGAVVLTSANGGRTWLSTKLPEGISAIDAISCPNPSTCFALASKGVAVPSSRPPAVPLTYVLLVYTAARD